MYVYIYIIIIIIYLSSSPYITIYIYINTISPSCRIMRGGSGILEAVQGFFGHLDPFRRRVHLKKPVGSGPQ